MGSRVSQGPRRIAGPVLAVCALAVLGGCNSSIDLRDDIFVGNWACEGKDVTLSVETIRTGDRTEKVAWIETGKNADYGLFTTAGARYSVYETKKNSITLHSHESGETLACKRRSA